MTEESMEKHNAPQDYAEEEVEGGFLRWMSVIVVLVAIAGFFGLAWYAYRSGTESVSAEEVPMVESDSAPMKEAPADPGGVQIPNQDKTVYDTIAGNAAKDHSVAERVLPGPEEPMAVKQDTSADKTAKTQTWINDKIYPDAAKNDEKPMKVVESDDSTEAEKQARVIHVEPGKEPGTQVITLKPAEKAAEATPAAGQQAAPVPSVDVSAAPVATKANQEAEKPLLLQGKQAVGRETDKTTPAEHKEAASVKKEAPMVKKTTKEVVKKAASGGGAVRVQLGAYKSQAEADKEWARISKKFSNELGSVSHHVQKADVPGKGTFYRLQLSGLSKGDAKTLCATLSAQKQGCFIAK